MWETANVCTVFILRKLVIFIDFEAVKDTRRSLRLGRPLERDFLSCTMLKLCVAQTSLGRTQIRKAKDYELSILSFY